MATNSIPVISARLFPLIAICIRVVRIVVRIVGEFRCQGLRLVAFGFRIRDARTVFVAAVVGVRSSSEERFTGFLRLFILFLSLNAAKSASILATSLVAFLAERLAMSLSSSSFLNLNSASFAYSRRMSQSNFWGTERKRRLVANSHHHGIVCGRC